MKKNILPVAVMLSLMHATTAHAYIVDPPETSDYGSWSKWEREEEQRWQDRLIATYAEDIKKIEDPVERLRAVVKAVAEYSTYDYELAIANALRPKEAQWADGILGSNTKCYYVELLSAEVGLYGTTLFGFESTTGVSIYINTTVINGVTYWSDVTSYQQATHEGRSAEANISLSTTTQPYWFRTQEQNEELVKQHLENREPDNIGPNGEVYGADGSVVGTMMNDSMLTQFLSEVKY